VRRRRAVGGVVSAVAATLVLTACGGGGSTPSQASTSLPSVSTTAGPEHFVRRWLADQQRMQVTGRTAPHVAANRRCEECRTLAHYVRSYYAAGGYVRGGAYRIRSIDYTPSQDGGIVTVHAQSAPETIRTSSAKPVHHFKARRVVLYLRVAWKGGGSYTVTSSTQG
jgi:hypothetical protein